VHLLTTMFHARLLKLGIPSFYDDYGPGTHSWPYWARDLRQSIGPVTAALTRSAAEPRTFDYTSADTHYTQYGWVVTMHRQGRKLSTLAGAGAAGFALSGTGTATVTTAPQLGRGVRYTITVDDRGGHRLLTRTVGASRRLQITVSLGSIGYTAHVHFTVDR